MRKILPCARYGVMGGELTNILHDKKAMFFITVPSLKKGKNCLHTSK